MLQSLLADRFQLKLHPGAKEMTVYHLRQVKKSSLLKPAAADETFSWNVALRHLVFKLKRETGARRIAYPTDSAATIGKSVVW